MFGGGAENDEERITHSLMIFRASFHRLGFYTDRHIDRQTQADTYRHRETDRQTDINTHKSSPMFPYSKSQSPC